MMAAAATRPLPGAEPNDPLLAAINLYRFAGEAYDDLPDDLDEEGDDEAFQRLCGDPDAILVAWTAPATSLEGATAALRMALQVLRENNGEPIVKSLLAASLAFFEGRCT
ncbi:hypothetical protein FJ417_24610 [Mesorhizobium sp. B3-1-7]|uniref:hypothetical protein n=1 Tax=Mesorhizobium sp. B3-1-7 TaxID=2589894 RepID=UPI001128123D|nr:hypothetical protein [Mesorhizobium sp. B3-1-7]TPI54736.1 hypothetical protein FJ417_24610 [Mesorhizobium sp. B3-1-7]